MTDPWQYGTFEGAEEHVFERTEAMSLRERLACLDQLIAMKDMFKDSSSSHNSPSAQNNTKEYDS